MLRVSLPHTVTVPDFSCDCFAFFGQWDSQLRSLEEVSQSSSLHLCPIDSRWLAELSPYGIIDKARNLMNAPLLGFVCFSDNGFPIVNELNGLLPIGSHPETGARLTARDKSILYDLFRSSGIPVVEYFRVERLDDLESIRKGLTAFKEHQYIIKPSSGEESDGVFVGDLHESLENTLANYRQSLSKYNVYDKDYHRGAHLFMEYISFQGEPLEICVDGYCCSGRLAFAQVQQKIGTRRTEPFYDTLMISPPIKSEVLSCQELVKETSQEILTALGVKNSVFHFEFRLSEQAAYPIDCALRGGGGYLAHSVRQFYNQDLRFLAIAEFIKPVQLPRLTTLTNDFCAIGVLQAVSLGQDKARQLTDRLSRDRRVIQYHLAQDFTNDAIYRRAAKLSLASRDSTASSALSVFDELIQEIGLEFIPS